MPTSESPAYYADAEEEEAVREWKRFLLTMILIGSGSVLALFLIILVVGEPHIRWPLLLALLLASSAFIVRRTFPARTKKVPTPVEDGLPTGGGWRSSRKVLDLALTGSPLSQMHTYNELRELLVRRYMILQGLSREEAEAHLIDPYSARSHLKDEDLVWLATSDLKREIAPENVKTEEGRRMVKEFPLRFETILSKVERLR